MTGITVHEWVEPSGGAEKVLDQFAQVFPENEIRVLWNDAPGRFLSEPTETWLSKTPLRNHKALCIPFLPPTWRMQRTGHTPDWVLVSSHLFAHHIKFRNIQKQPLKFAYVHTPARYIWTPEHDSRGQHGIVRIFARLFKPIDRARAQEIDFIAANSEFTRDRIRQTWGRESTVIYPPVDVFQMQERAKAELNPTEQAIIDTLPPSYLFGASRLVEYKRLDAVISAGIQTGEPVIIAGEGPERARLEQLAFESGVDVRFLGRVSDELLMHLYKRARVFIFPPVEDFGIMPVEAMANGTPVITNRLGGAFESVSSIEGGVSIDIEDPAQWSIALAATDKIDRNGLAQRAQRFDSSVFRTSLRKWMLEGGANI